MPRRSLHEDGLLIAALHLDTEMDHWGLSDLSDTANMLTGEEIALHVTTRALRKFRAQSWVIAENDPDTSVGPRLLYELTNTSGVPVALSAAGREMAEGKLYPIPIIARFAGTAVGQEILAQTLQVS